MAFIVRREELAWAAGLFDGEGYMGRRHHRGGRTYQAVIDVSQNDRRVLDRFQKAVGVGKVYGPYRSATRNPQWHYAVMELERVQAVVAMLWHWLSPVKREQCRRALVDIREAYLAAPGKLNTRTMCKHGHPFDQVNTKFYVTQKGYTGRFCRTCGRERVARSAQRKRLRLVPKPNVAS